MKSANGTGLHATAEQVAGRRNRQPALCGRSQLLQGREVDNDGRVERMLYAGDLGKAKDIFAKAIKHRPRIRLTIRQRTRWHSTSLDARRCCAGFIPRLWH